ncbi:MAG TPA: cysteine desulfuration protein SufE [Candidatus Latescibacteria bacterium]|jgi:cysteine desulfuration protein SufE|nr:cysteine desulfuration protein SufE [Candidatus Latescibacterota bacterium]|tara:strand:+ start:414 stop:833 length:420 start_codon:yes stop_codon:yes gene_type:complete
MPELTVDRLIQNFEILGNWEERYRYVIDLGRKLPDLDEKYKVEDNRVKGCVSNVWLITLVNDDKTPTLEFKADSDAHIVRGLVTILLAIYSGRTAKEILAVDIKDIFQQLDLESHLSPSRSNGFFSMVERIKALAQAAA